MQGEQVFETLSEAISYVFRQEQTSMLSLDKLCQVLTNPNLKIKTKTSGIVPCSTINRRRISSTLSSCDLFVRAGPPRTCLWAIRPHNPLLLSDGQISTSVESVLINYGPMTLEQIVEHSDLSGADECLFDRFLTEHCAEFSPAEDGTYWFAGQPRPIPNNFENINSALLFAFKQFPQGASVEELHWYLCLSTVGKEKRITRRTVSRELSRRSDIFYHLSRAKYALLSGPNTIRTHSLPITRQEPRISLGSIHGLTPPSIPNFFNSLSEPQPERIQHPIPAPPIPQLVMPQLDLFSDRELVDPLKPLDEDFFDPDNFFNSEFQFSYD